MDTILLICFLACFRLFLTAKDDVALVNIFMSTLLQCAYKCLSLTPRVQWFHNESFEQKYLRIERVCPLLSLARTANHHITSPTTFIMIVTRTHRIYDDTSKVAESVNVFFFICVVI